MTVCNICGGTEFEGHGGHYYCTECSTQTHEICDVQDDAAAGYANIQASLFLSTKSTTKAKEKKGPQFGDTWTTHEAYNAIICQQVKSLIKMGASPKLKDVVLQLWALYLKKNEVAFKEENSKSDDWEPRLSAFPRKRDVQVLTGETEISYRKKTLKRKKKEKKKKEAMIKEKNNGEKEMQVDVATPADVVESVAAKQVETLGDDGEKVPGDLNETITYKMRPASELKQSRMAKNLQKKEGKKTLKALPPHVREFYCEFMSLPKTLCFCYLGLLLLKEDILLCDIIRFAEEGSVPYRDATHHLPATMKLQDSDWAVFTPGAPPNLKKIASLSTHLAVFVELPELPSRPLLPIAVRFIKDFGLPDDLITVVKNLLEKHPSPGPWIPLKKTRVNSTNIPLYEVEAMAHVLVAAKLVFGLDGKTERELSEFAYKKNTEDSNLNYFVWHEWLTNMKLKQLFLRSRNIPIFYLHHRTLDVEVINSNYFDVLKKWTHRTSIPKKTYRFAQPRFHNEMKKVFSDALTKRNNYNNQSVCSASSFPLQSKLCQQLSLLNNSHQYLLSQADSKTLLRNFSSCSLSFIFSYKSHHKLQTKSRHKRRLLHQEISTECNLDLCEMPDDNCAAADASESNETENSSGNDVSVIDTEGHSGPPRKRKRDGESCTKTSKRKKHDKHSEVKVCKKKSQNERNRGDSESENVENWEENIGADVDDTETKKKRSAVKNSKNSVKLKKAKKQKKSKTHKEKIRVEKKKKKEKINKEEKGSDGKLQAFLKNYWYINCPLTKIQQACDKLPETFKWLLQFTSEMIETSIDVLYYEMLVVEQRLFKSKLKSKW